MGAVDGARSASSCRGAHPCRPCGIDGCGGGKVSECLTTLAVDACYAQFDALLARDARSRGSAARVTLMRLARHPPALHAVRRRRALPRAARSRRCSSAASRSRSTRAHGRGGATGTHRAAHRRSVPRRRPVARRGLRARRVPGARAAPTSTSSSRTSASPAATSSAPATACTPRGSTSGCAISASVRRAWRADQSASSLSARDGAADVRERPAARGDLQFEDGAKTTSARASPCADERLHVIYNAVDDATSSRRSCARIARALRARHRHSGGCDGVPAGRLGLRAQRASRRRSTRSRWCRHPRI